MGIMASMALRPVAMGSRTGWRSMMPGARRSMGKQLVEAMGPLSSMGWPSALTTRPIMPSPTGTLKIVPVRLTSLPSLSSVYSPRITAPTWSSSRLERQPGDAVRKAEQLAGHDLVQAVQAGNAVAQRCDGPDFVHLDLGVVVRDLLAKKLRNLVCLDLSHFFPQGSGVRGQGSVFSAHVRNTDQKPPISFISLISISDFLYFLTEYSSYLRPGLF